MLYFPSSWHRGFAERLNLRVPDFRESMTVVSDGKPTGAVAARQRVEEPHCFVVAWKRSRRGLSEMARA